MSKVTSVRTSVQSDNVAASGSKPKPIHYVNFECLETGADHGYRTIDHLPAIDIEIAQHSEQACQKRFGNEYERAYYRQAGVKKSVSAPTRSLADFI